MVSCCKLSKSSLSTQTLEGKSPWYCIPSVKLDSIFSDTVLFCPGLIVTLFRMFTVLGLWIAFWGTKVWFSATVQRMRLYAHSRVLHLSASLRSINREQRSWTKWRLLRSTNENRPVPSQMPVSWFEDVTTEIDSWTKLPFFFFKVLETVAYARHSFPFKWEIPFWKVSVRLLKTSWDRDYSSKGHK